MWRCCQKSLRLVLCRKSVNAGGRELKPNQPFAGDGVTVGLGSGKFPAAGSLFGEIGKVFAGTRIIKSDVGDASGGIDLHTRSDVKRAVNGGQSLLRGGRKNLVEYFAASEIGCRGLRGSGRRGRFRTENGEGGGCVPRVKGSGHGSVFRSEGIDSLLGRRRNSKGIGFRRVDLGRRSGNRFEGSRGLRGRGDSRSGLGSGGRGWRGGDRVRAKAEKPGHGKYADDEDECAEQRRDQEIG